MSDTELPSVEDILEAVRRALTSDSGLNDFHRFAARQEASVQESLRRQDEPGQEAA